MSPLKTLNNTEEKPLIELRPYQQKVFNDRKTGVQVLFWSRQIGKSYTIACWCVDRLLTRPGRLITILSNSRDNGAELNQKIRDVCDKLGVVMEQEDQSPDLQYENMIMETRIKVGGKIGRVKVLAANPRTARGFSGDLILDEFAFHENSRAIWEAAEPILSSDPDFLCLIASTPNGTHNMFYTMVTTPDLFSVSKVRRSDACKMGVKIYHPTTRQSISPEEARKLALDKRAYDQNYELIFADENMALLTYELIGAAERSDVGVVCEGEWSREALKFLSDIQGELFVGVDVGRHRDWTVITALEKLGPLYLARAILRLEKMRLPDQQRRLEVVCSQPKFRRACIDLTGIGLGLCEYTQEKFGMTRIQGINFASTVPITKKIKLEGRKQQTVRVTEAMAVEMLSVYEDRAIKQPIDSIMRDDMRKPERVTSPGGRVSIAATSDDVGHADHFWSVALALEASHQGGTPTKPHAPKNSKRHRALAARRNRQVAA